MAESVAVETTIPVVSVAVLIIDVADDVGIPVIVTSIPLSPLPVLKMASVADGLAVADETCEASRNMQSQYRYFQTNFLARQNLEQMM